MLDTRLEGPGKVGGSRVSVTIYDCGLNEADGAEVDSAAPESSAISSEA